MREDVRVEIWEESKWRGCVQAHEERVESWVAPHLERRSIGLTHPVDDFLFTYYSYRPAALRRWHPGIGVALTGPSIGEFLSRKWYVVERGQARATPTKGDNLHARTTYVRHLLAATTARPALLGCFGLHEWAMVYRQPADERRHPTYPLRLGAGGTDAVVESHRLTCTHYDAFRFFTVPAKGLNVIQPRREDQPQQDQPGCLHATMDCYKWAYKLAPFSSSELVADCFSLAREVREVDMRAAPYDLSSLDIEPIAIETAQGKADYMSAQSNFARRAADLRARLIATCDAILEEIKVTSA